MARNARSSRKKRCRPSDRDLKRRNEGSIIKWYVILQNFVSMAVSGLGYLAVTWSTVVLLGGFVSSLQKKDFWYITVLNLVQVLRIFNSFDDAKVLYLILVFVAPIFGFIVRFKKTKRFTGLREARWLVKAGVAIFITLFLLVMLVVGLFVSAVVISGIVMSIVIPVARFKDHDYTYTAEGSSANLKPALNIFYSLSLAQGMLYWTWYILAFLRHVALVTVIKECQLGKWGKASVLGYMKTTSDRCGKNPSLAQGWNLIQYAVGLLESESLEDYLHGASMIDTFMKKGIAIEPLIRSSRRKTKKLLRTLGWTRPEDRQIRVLASRIVANLAGDLHLAELPGATKLISSLLETSMPSSSKQQRIFRDDGENVNQDAERLHAVNKELIVNGLLILERVAKERHNCTEIYCTEGLLENIIELTCANTMIPHDKGSAWKDIVSGAISVVRQLISAPGDTSRKIRYTVSSNEKVVSNMEKVLGSDRFPLQASERALDILTELAVDTSTNLAKERRENIIRVLLLTFLDSFREPSLVQMAGQALVKLTQENQINSNALLNVTECGTVVDRLTNIIDFMSSISYVTTAAEILENLFLNCKIDEAYVKDTALPKILNALLQPRQDAITAATVQNGYPAAEMDAEDPHPPRSSQVILSPSTDQNDEQHMEWRKLEAALLSLIAAIRAKWISADEFAASVGPLVPDFLRKLRQIVEANRKDTVECLRTQKVAAELVVSMLKEGQYVDAIRSQGITESLREALGTVSHLEDCMSFMGTHGDKGKPVWPLLSSLVRKAQELLDDTITNGG